MADMVVELTGMVGQMARDEVDSEAYTLTRAPQPS
jgi:hypothetical protein